MAMPTLGAFLWDFFLGISFVLGAMIALPRKNVSKWKVIMLILECALILSVLDVIQKQDPDNLAAYLALFMIAGALELTAIILGTRYTEGTIYKRMVINSFSIIFASAIVFAICAFIEPAKDVMAAETTARDSEGIGYLIVCAVQIVATVMSAFLVKLILKWLKGDGVAYRILFAVIILYDVIGVPARGYVNYKSRHETPARDEVLIVLGITYLIMTLTIVVVVAVMANVSKGREASLVGKKIKQRSIMEDKIKNEFDQVAETGDDIDQVIGDIETELKARGTVLELLSDMPVVKKLLDSRAAKLKRELEDIRESLPEIKGSGGYMTICVRPLGDAMMLMCEMGFREGYEGNGRRVITRVL